MGSLGVIDNGISANAAADCIASDLPLSHLTFPPWTIRPCDAASCQNSLTTCLWRERTKFMVEDLSPQWRQRNHWFYALLKFTIRVTATSKSAFLPSTRHGGVGKALVFYAVLLHYLTFLFLHCVHYCDAEVSVVLFVCLPVCLFGSLLYCILSSWRINVYRSKIKVTGGRV